MQKDAKRCKKMQKDAKRCKKMQKDAKRCNGKLIITKINEKINFIYFFIFKTIFVGYDQLCLVIFSYVSIYMYFIFTNIFIIKTILYYCII